MWNRPATGSLRSRRKAPENFHGEESLFRPCAGPGCAVRAGGPGSLVCPRCGHGPLRHRRRAPGIRLVLGADVAVAPPAPTTDRRPPDGGLGPVPVTGRVPPGKRRHFAVAEVGFGAWGTGARAVGGTHEKGSRSSRQVPVPGQEYGTGGRCRKRAAARAPA